MSKPEIDYTPRYAPTTAMIVGRGMVPVTGYIAHPPGTHPKNCPLVPDCVALELKTEFGSRWYGCERAYINSELRMVVVGTNTRDEVRMRWEVCARV